MSTIQLNWMMQQCNYLARSKACILSIEKESTRITCWLTVTEAKCIQWTFQRYSDFGRFDMLTVFPLFHIKRDYHLLSARRLIDFMLRFRSKNISKEKKKKTFDFFDLLQWCFEGNEKKHQINRECISCVMKKKWKPIRARS